MKTHIKTGHLDQPGLSSPLSSSSLSMTPLSSRDQVSRNFEKKRKLKVQKKIKEKEVIQKEKRFRQSKACRRSDKNMAEFEEKVLNLKRRLLKLDHAVQNLYMQELGETAEFPPLTKFMHNVEFHMKEAIVSEFSANEQQLYYIRNRPDYEAFSELHIRHVLMGDSRIRGIFLHKYFNGDENLYLTFLTDSIDLKQITSEEDHLMGYRDSYNSKQMILYFIAQADCDASLKIRATSYAEWLPPVVPFLKSLHVDSTWID